MIITHNSQSWHLCVTWNIMHAKFAKVFKKLLRSGPFFGTPSSLPSATVLLEGNVFKTSFCSQSGMCFSGPSQVHGYAWSHVPSGVVENARGWGLCIHRVGTHLPDRGPGRGWLLILRKVHPLLLTSSGGHWSGWHALYLEGILVSI